MVIHKSQPPQYGVSMDIYERLLPVFRAQHGRNVLRIVATDLLTLDVYWFTFDLRDVGASIWLNPRKVN